MQSKVSGNFARKKGGWFDARMFFPRVPSSFGAVARHVIGSQRLNDFVSVLDLWPSFKGGWWQPRAWQCLWVTPDRSIRRRTWLCRGHWTRLPTPTLVVRQRVLWRLCHWAGPSHCWATPRRTWGTTSATCSHYSTHSEVEWQVVEPWVDSRSHNWAPQFLLFLQRIQKGKETPFLKKRPRAKCKHNGRMVALPARVCSVYIGGLWSRSTRPTKEGISTKRYQRVQTLYYRPNINRNSTNQQPTTNNQHQQVMLIREAMN